MLALLMCLAPFDDGSFYKLEATLKNGHIQSPVKFSYVTTDGLDLRAKLKVSEEKFLAEKSFELTASNDSMAVKAGADYWPEDKNYQGALEVSFNYDGTPPVAVVMECTAK